MCYIYKSDMNHPLSKAVAPNLLFSVQDLAYKLVCCHKFELWHRKCQSYPPASKTKVPTWIICPEVIDVRQVLIMCFILDLLHQKKKKKKPTKHKQQLLNSCVLKLSCKPVRNTFCLIQNFSNAHRYACTKLSSYIWGLTVGWSTPTSSQDQTGYENTGKLY